jgi:chromosome segregation ATPase
LIATDDLTPLASLVEARGNIEGELDKLREILERTNEQIDELMNIKEAVIKELNTTVRAANKLEVVIENKKKWLAPLEKAHDKPDAKKQVWYIPKFWS